MDGTLYKPVPEMVADRLESSYLVIEKHRGWTREKTISEFKKTYPKVTPSITKASALLGQIPLPQAAYENELYKHRTKYLKRDPELVQLFKQLNSFSHYMLVNGIQSVTRKSLALLGVPAKTFTEIVTSEIVGVNKPDIKGYKYILHKTGLVPEKHLMIGDREQVDLAPAKNLGMKTCLVWAEKTSHVADITLLKVYDVEKVLL